MSTKILGSHLVLFSYHDVPFQKLCRLQGDAYTASVAWTNVTEGKNNREVRQSEPEFGSHHKYLQKAVTLN